MPSISDQEYERLKTSLDELSALNEIAMAINLSMSVETITQVILDRCLKRIDADQGAVFLLDDDLADIDMFHTFIREKDSTSLDTPFHLNKTLIGWMIKNRTMLTVNDPESDQRFPGIDFKAIGVTSLLSSPLMSRSGLIGVLALTNKKTAGGFTDNDRRFLGIVGTQTAKVIENAKLFEKEQRLLVIEEEMKVAKSIQKDYLPRQDLVTDHYEIFGFNEAAKDVGGDYYDMFPLVERRVVVSIGDVSGKGVPAALMASEAQAVVRSSFHTNSNMSLDALAVCLNKVIFEMTKPEQYITAFMATYDTSERVLSYVNAGHIPPLIVSADGGLRQLPEASLVIGVLDGAPYVVGKERLESGDMLFVCTDGVTENEEPGGEQYGEDRLKSFLASCSGASLETIRDRLCAKLSSFRQGLPRPDDITFLMLRVK